MRHDELVAKLEDLRSIIADKLAELAERPKWGSEDEREEVINAIDDLDGQLDLLREALEQPDDDGVDPSGEPWPVLGSVFAPAPAAPRALPTSRTQGPAVRRRSTSSEMVAMVPAMTSSSARVALKIAIAGR